MRKPKSFFVSYSTSDETWARWIAWELEEAGFRVTVQTWDFPVGSNFVLEMHKGLLEAERVILLLSPDSLVSDFVGPEWATAFSTDPEGGQRRLVPIRIRECSVGGLLSNIVYLDLVGKSEEEARRELIGAVKRQRLKPLVAPKFPGRVTHETPLEFVATTMEVLQVQVERLLTLCTGISNEELDDLMDLVTQERATRVGVFARSVANERIADLSITINQELAASSGGFDPAPIMGKWSNGLCIELDEAMKALVSFSQDSQAIMGWYAEVTQGDSTQGRSSSPVPPWNNAYKQSRADLEVPELQDLVVSLVLAE